MTERSSEGSKKRKFGKSAEKGAADGSSAAVETADPRSSTTSVELQRCQFVKWEVAGIIAAASRESRLAVARTNNSVEVRTLKEKNAVVGFIPGGPTVVTALAFHGERLLVSRIDGSVTVYNYETRTVRETLYPSEGPVWCLSTSPDDDAVAAGCEDGSIRILRLDETGRYNVNKLVGGTVRVTAVAWNARATVIAAGDCKGSLRIFDVRKARSKSHARIISGKERVIIWSIAVCSKAILTGDSRGIVTVWSSDMLLAEKEVNIENLAGDITSLCVAGSTVFVGAANGAIGLMQRTSEGGWVERRGRRCHLSDLRAIVRYGKKSKIASVGMDSLILVHSRKSFLNERPSKRLKPTLSPECMSPVQVRKGMALSLYDDRFELWRMPSDLFPASKPVLLLRMRPGDLGGSLMAATLSEDMRTLAISGSERTVLFSLGEDLSIVDIKQMSAQLPASKWMAFVDNDKLACIDQHGKALTLYDTSGQVSRHWSADKLCGRKKKKDRSNKHVFLKHVAARSDGLISALGSNGFVCIVDSLSTPKDKPIVASFKVSKLSLIALHPRESLLATVDAKAVSLYNFRGSNHQKLSEVPLPGGARSFPSDISYVHGRECWAVFGRDFASLVRPKTSKKRKRDSVTSSRMSVSIPFDASSNVLGLGEIQKGSIAFIERPWDLVVPTLPAAIRRKLFAT